MRCPKCFAEFAPGSSACPKCGNALAESQQSTPAPTSSRPKWVFPVAGGLVAVLLLALVAAWAMKGKSATNASEKPVSGPSVTNAPVMPAGGSSVTNAPNIPGGPVTTPQVPATKAPQAVVDYLAFVKDIEAQRQQLVKGSSSAEDLKKGSIDAAINSVTSGDISSENSNPLEPLKKHFSESLSTWQDLLRRFDSRQSPQEVSEFASAYRDVLSRQTASTAQVVAALSKVNSDGDGMSQLQEVLKSMQSEVGKGGEVDKAIDKAKQDLDRVCSRYGLAKTFDITKEGEVPPGNVTGGL